MDINKLGEFGLIDKIKRGIVVPDGIIGIGDDCAVIPQKDGRETLVTTDMLIEGVHFLIEDITPYNLGWKSAAVNISDIAAMGGKCTASFLSFALPQSVDSEWIDDFFRGYGDLSEKFNCPLLGGDTTTSLGALCISVTIIGYSAIGNSIKRDGAKEGDLICVTGNLGDSACGLKLILNGCERDKDGETLISRHYLPLPKIAKGVKIAEAGANSMMDISDGIGSDLRHIIEASGVGAEIDTSMIPLSNELKSKCAEYGWDPLELAISGGEDYELLFTISEENAKKIDFEHYVIGKIISGDKIIWRGSNKDFIGFRHF